MALSALFRSYRGAEDVLYFGIIVSFLFRWCTGFFPYSGANKPPMFGDYEAQRHWMEVTVNLSPKEWYKNGTDNDLLYWGLDYPPLTAYHSYICGKIAQWIDPSWVALFSSRGFESYHHKIFMRTTVMVSDLLTFLPAVLFYWAITSPPCLSKDKAIAVTLTLLYPGLILIDHGHFQYNSVSLGLSLFGICFLHQGKDFLGAMAFTLALLFKQMSLYFAIPFFFYLLGTCLQKPKLQGALKFLCLGMVVIATVAAVWLPFLPKLNDALAVVVRMFPLSRGLYEDKVANVWCALSVVIKMKSLFSVKSLALISAITTLFASLPMAINLLVDPTFLRFRLALVNSSLIFFLFSFQVHEKSILLASLPVSLLLEDYPVAVTWFSVISTFSLLPLLIKDGLVLPYFVLMVLYLTGSFITYGKELLHLKFEWHKLQTKVIMFWQSVFGVAVLSFAALLVKPPERYPDLHAVLNCLFSCIHFIGFAVYFNMQQLRLAIGLTNHFSSSLKSHCE